MPESRHLCVKGPAELSERVSTENEKVGELLGTGRNAAHR